MNKGKELVKAMESFINSADCTDIEDFASHFVNMHNTLEQKSVGMLLKTLTKVSEKKYTDGRNEACVKASRLLIEGYKKELIADLIVNDTYYEGRESRAEKWVRGDGFDISHMPLV